MTSNDECVTSVFETDLGWMGLQWSGPRLLRSTFGHANPGTALDSLPKPDEPREKLNRIQRELVQRLTRYASGKSRGFGDVDLEFRGFTSFQMAILNACRKLAWGQTATYGELAARAGSPRAARAVGTVMSSNRFPIIIPCHRVIAAGHRPGGFTAPGGVSLKERMLTMEGWESQSRPTN